VTKHLILKGKTAEEIHGDMSLTSGEQNVLPTRELKTGLVDLRQDVSAQQLT
jgi:hypothetical protein